MENKFKIIDNLCNKIINNFTYYKHSDIDIFVTLKLQGLKNFINILSSKQKEFLEAYSNANEEYISPHKPLNQHANFNENFEYSYKNPFIEVYFKAELIVNGILIEPSIVSDIILIEKFSVPLTFKYKIKELTKEAYVRISLYTTQLPEDESLLGISEIRLFEYNTLNLYQGVKVIKIYNQFEYELFKRRTDSERIPLNDEENIETIRIEREKLFLMKERENEINNLVRNYHKNIPKTTYVNNFTINYNYIELPSDGPNNENQLGSDKTRLRSDREQVFSIGIPDAKEINSLQNNFSNSEKRLLYESSDCYLELEFLSFERPIVYYEEQNKLTFFTSFTKPLSTQMFNDPYLYSNTDKKNWICDHELRKNNTFLIKDNPITEKFLFLSRLNDDAFAKEIRPNPNDSKLIESIIPKPDFIKLKASDSYLFWKYRYHLLNRKNCLTKILNSVQWGDQKSENEFLNNILSSWKEVELGDILYMLSFKFCLNPLYQKHIHQKFNHVRLFAVKQLDGVSDKELEFVLLQLVQALRYEDSSSYLKSYLIKRCSLNLQLASCLYWFLNVEADDENLKDLKVRESEMIDYYKKVLKEFYMSLDDSIKNGIESQLELRKRFIEVALELAKAKNKEQKTIKLEKIIKTGGSCDMTKLDPPLNLPIDPLIKVSSVLPDKGIVFASAKYPIKYSFYVASECQEKLSNKENPGVYDLMFKYGDDLRQDQLILQIIAYMDMFLRKVNIDNEFTTYKVLATSKSDGFVEFVSGCKTITDILKSYNDSINPYFEKLSSSSSVSYNQIMESYINSCSGYCVVTYILGIGDRHLENILINKLGRLLHIDFGYILGKDPKPYPPPMKLSKQMVQCMGNDFSRFKKKCSDTYLILRQNARLIVNMFYLMIHSGITELTENYEQSLTKLHEKFVPDMNNEEASLSLNTKLEESYSALFPKMMDVLHDLVQNIK